MDTARLSLPANFLSNSCGRDRGHGAVTVLRFEIKLIIQINQRAERVALYTFYILVMEFMKPCNCEKTVFSIILDWLAH